MAPEQLRGQRAQPPSDIWALGVVLYEMASGTRPFEGHTPFELSAAILNEAPAPLPPHVPPALRAVIARCLEKEPGQRYKTGSEVRAALDGLQTGVGISQTFAQVGPAFGSKDPPRRATVTRRRAIWLGGAAVTAMASAVAAWRLAPRSVATRSLAVLPFENPVKDEDLEYLCDGVAESLIHQMARLRSLRVINLSTVLNFKGQGGGPARGRESAWSGDDSGGFDRAPGCAPADLRSTRRRGHRQGALDQQLRPRRVGPARRPG